MSVHIIDDIVSERFQVIGKLTWPHLGLPYAPKHSTNQQPYYDASLILSVENAAMVQAAAETHALQAWPDITDVYMPIKLDRFGRWAFFARNICQARLSDINGMPERADFFASGQTVEFDVQFCTKWLRMPLPLTNGKTELRAVEAQLLGVKLIGGFVRSTE